MSEDEIADLLAFACVRECSEQDSDPSAVDRWTAVSVRFGMLKIIACKTRVEFDTWKTCRDALLCHRPVTKKESSDVCEIIRGTKSKENCK